MYSAKPSGFQVPIEEVVKAYSISRNETLLHRIVCHYQPLIDDAVSYLSGKYNIHDSGFFGRGDLSSAGVCGFIEALNRFNPDRGVPLEAFAKRRVRGEMIDQLRTYGSLPRGVIQRANAFDRFRYAGEDAYAMAARDMGTSEEKIRRAVWIRDNGRFLIDPNIEERQDFAAHPDQEEKLQASLVRTAIDALPPREKRAVIDFFYAGMTDAEIGNSGNLGNRVSENRANQLRKKGLERLAKMLSSPN